MNGATPLVRLLVVDDDPDDVALIRDLLSDATRTRFAIEDTTAAQDALGLLDQKKYDAVLVDYRLPNQSMNGLDFVRIVAERHPGVPLILITGIGNEAKTMQADALAAGAIEYLEKGTFTTDLLERTVLYAIGYYQRRNETGTPGVGMLIEQLVALNRRSVEAQTRSADEATGLRADFKVMLETMNQQHAARSQQIAGGTTVTVNALAEAKKEILDAVQASKLERALAWTVEHPKYAAFLALSILALLSALAAIIIGLTHWIDPVGVEVIKEAVKPTSWLTGGPRWG